MRATPADTAARVEHIASMMRAGTWKRGKSAPTLGREWSLATATVEALAAEASRVVAREVTDPQAVAETVTTALAVNLERATDDRKYGDVAKLGDVWTRIVGARAPERHHVEVEAYERLSPAQMLTKIREQIATLTELERKYAEQVESITVPALPAASEEP